MHSLSYKNIVTIILFFNIVLCTLVQLYKTQDRTLNTCNK